MRVSIKDPYVNVAVKLVRLNSEVINICVTADDTLGFVEVYQLDHNGIIIMDNTGKPMTTTRKGEVKIVLHEDWEYVGGQLRMAE